MKNYIMLGLGFMVINAAVSQPKNPCAMLDQNYRWMQDSLSLTPVQKEKIIGYKNSACAGMAEARKAKKGNKDSARAAMGRIMKNYRKQVMQVLDNNQKERLKQYNQNNKMGKVNDKPKIRSTYMERADLRTAMLKENLQLTPVQVTAVTSINKEQAALLEAHRNKWSGKLKDSIAVVERQVLKKAYHQKITSVLTVKQQEKYKEIITAQRAVRKSENG
jgi:hypothetical protein